MIGFAKKDLFLLKGNAKVFLLMTIAFGFMALSNLSFLAFLVPMLIISLSSTLFNYDTYNNWDAYAISFPNGRKNAVLGRCTAILFLMGIGVLIVCLFAIGINLVQANFPIQEAFLAILGSFIATVIILSLMIPFLYKFGSEKGRTIIFIIMFLISFLIGVAYKGYQALNINIDFTWVINMLNQYWFFIIPITCLLVIIISYTISKHIYLKKEF